jgi:uncharacterized protein (TIGR02145 family)
MMQAKPMASLNDRGRAVLSIIVTAIFIPIIIAAKISNQICVCQTISLNAGDSLVVDKEGNKYPIKVFAENRLWMTSNLKLNVPGSYCYEDKGENCKKYGRLYTWESALVGCRLLGEGWRLPTNEEWLQLSQLQGVTSIDSNAIRKETYKALLKSGSSGFNAILGGGRGPDTRFSRLDAHGFYWTATETDSSLAWFANFAKGSEALYLQNDGEKPRAFSVRCVKDIGMLK